MRQINPFMAAAHRSGEPEVNAGKSRRYLRRVHACAVDAKKYRLHYGDIPVGIVVTARDMDIHAWNRNARAFAAHQATLGRELLPVLEWKDVGAENQSCVWRVVFRENGKEKEKLVSAQSKAGAKREFESMSSVAAVIKLIEMDQDIQGATQAIRAQNGESPITESEIEP